MDQLRFNVNGQDLTLPGSFDLGKNLNSVIKSETGFKARMSFCIKLSWCSSTVSELDLAPTSSLQGTKLACSEGGCGACAVQVASYNVATGCVCKPSAPQVRRGLSAVPEGGLAYRIRPDGLPTSLLQGQSKDAVSTPVFVLLAHSMAV